jgi:uncharacterized paraquat-inducible protein A
MRSTRCWTHYVPVFSGARGRDEQAICLRCIHPSNHSATPTCPRCRELLDQRLEPAERPTAVERRPDPVDSWA